MLSFVHIRKKMNYIPDMQAMVYDHNNLDLTQHREKDKG
jgi:hypothetical protein